MNPAWDEFIELRSGRYRGKARVRRTPGGWVVEQYEWWRNLYGNKVGHRCYYRWVKTETKAESVAEWCNTPGPNSVLVSHKETA